MNKIKNLLMALAAFVMLSSVAVAQVPEMKFDTRQSGRGCSASIYNFSLFSKWGYDSTYISVSAFTLNLSKVEVKFLGYGPLANEAFPIVSERIYYNVGETVNSYNLNPTGGQRTPFDTVDIINYWSINLIIRVYEASPTPYSNGTTRWVEVGQARVEGKR
jgi:hypothetical protein